MKVLVILLVLISFVIPQAFGQYIGDKIPPGTMIPDYDDDYIFPPDYVDFYYSDSRFEKFSVTDQQYRYDIPYMISNGTISSMNINCSDVELVLNVNPSGDKGWITLALPRILIDSKMGGGQDDVFVVFLDSKEILESDIASDKLRLLVIPFSNNVSQVSILGVNYPEQEGANACNGKHEPPFSYLLSPLKQIQSGISFNEIQCKQNLVLIQKYDDSPACVTESTKTKLIERRWTKILESSPDDDSPIHVPERMYDARWVTEYDKSFPITHKNNVTYDQLKEKLEIVRNSELRIVSSGIDYDIGQLVLYSDDLTIKEDIKKVLGDFPFVLLFEETPARWIHGGPKPEPEPERTTDSEMKLRKAKDALETAYFNTVNVGNFYIKDVIVGFGTYNNTLVIDIPSEYIGTRSMDAIKQDIRHIVGNDVQIDYVLYDESIARFIPTVMPYLWNQFLNQKGIEYVPKNQTYWNHGDGFVEHDRVCSPIIASNGTELYISTTFDLEPFQITGTHIDKHEPSDCHKTWKTDAIMPEPDRVTALWLKNQMIQNEN